MTESTARAADGALRAKAEEFEARARGMDDRRAAPAGYHNNSLAWIAATAPDLRESAQALRDLDRKLLKEALDAAPAPEVVQ